MSVEVVVLGLFWEIEAVELESSGNFLLTLEQGQRNLQVVVGDQHAERDDGVGYAQDPEVCDRTNEQNKFNYLISIIGILDNTKKY